MSGPPGTALSQPVVGPPGFLGGAPTGVGSSIPVQVAPSSTPAPGAPPSSQAGGSFPLPNAISEQIQFQSNPTVNYAFVLRRYQSAKRDAYDPTVDKGQLCFLTEGLSDEDESTPNAEPEAMGTSLPYMNALLAMITYNPLQASTAKDRNLTLYETARKILNFVDFSDKNEQRHEYGTPWVDDFYAGGYLGGDGGSVPLSLSVFGGGGGGSAPRTKEDFALKAADSDGIDELYLEYQQNQSRLRQTQLDLDAVVAQLDEKNADITVLEDGIKKREAALEAADSAWKACETRLESSERERATAKSNVEALQAQMAERVTQFQKLTRESDDLKQDVITLRAKVQAHETKMTTMVSAYIYNQCWDQLAAKVTSDAAASDNPGKDKAVQVIQFLTVQLGIAQSGVRAKLRGAGAVTEELMNATPLGDIDEAVKAQVSSMDGFLNELYTTTRPVDASVEAIDEDALEEAARGAFEMGSMLLPQFYEQTAARESGVGGLFCTSVSPDEFATSQRKLFVDDHLPVEQIAVSVGLSDSGRFSRLFPSDVRAPSRSFWPHLDKMSCEIDSESTANTNTFVESLAIALHARHGTDVNDAVAATHKEIADFQLLANGFWYDATGSVTHASALLAGTGAEKDIPRVYMSFLSDDAHVVMGTNPEYSAAWVQSCHRDKDCCYSKACVQNCRDGSVARVLHELDTQRLAVGSGPAYTWNECFSRVGSLAAEGMFIRSNVQALRKKQGVAWCSDTLLHMPISAGAPIAKDNEYARYENTRVSVAPSQLLNVPLTHQNGRGQRLRTLTGGVPRKAVHTQVQGGFGNQYTQESMRENVGVCNFLFNVVYEYYNAATGAHVAHQSPFTRALKTAVYRDTGVSSQGFVGFGGGTCAKDKIGSDLLAFCFETHASSVSMKVDDTLRASAPAVEAEAVQLMSEAYVCIDSETINSAARVGFFGSKDFGVLSVPKQSVQGSTFSYTCTGDVVASHKSNTVYDSALSTASARVIQDISYATYLQRAAAKVFNVAEDSSAHWLELPTLGVAQGAKSPYWIDAWKSLAATFAPTRHRIMDQVVHEVVTSGVAATDAIESIMLSSTNTANTVARQAPLDAAPAVQLPSECNVKQALLADMWNFERTGGTSALTCSPVATSNSTVLSLDFYTDANRDSMDIDKTTSSVFASTCGIDAVLERARCSQERIHSILHEVSMTRAQRDIRACLLSSVTAAQASISVPENTTTANRAADTYKIVSQMKISAQTSSGDYGNTLAIAKGAARIASVVWDQLTNTPLTCQYEFSQTHRDVRRCQAVALTKTLDQLSASEIANCVLPSLHAAIADVSNLGILCNGVELYSAQIDAMYEQDTEFSDPQMTTWGTTLFGARNDNERVERSPYYGRLQDIYRRTESTSMSASMYLSVANEMIDHIGMLVARTALLHPANSKNNPFYAAMCKTGSDDAFRRSLVQIHRAFATPQQETGGNSVGKQLARLAAARTYGAANGSDKQVHSSFKHLLARVMQKPCLDVALEEFGPTARSTLTGAKTAAIAFAETELSVSQVVRDLTAAGHKAAGADIKSTFSLISSELNQKWNRVCAIVNDIDEQVTRTVMQSTDDVANLMTSYSNHAATISFSLAMIQGVRTADRGSVHIHQGFTHRDRNTVSAGPQVAAYTPMIPAPPSEYVGIMIHGGVDAAKRNAELANVGLFSVGAAKAPDVQLYVCGTNANGGSPAIIQSTDTAWADVRLAVVKNACAFFSAAQVLEPLVSEPPEPLELLPVDGGLDSDIVREAVDQLRSVTDYRTSRTSCTVAEALALTNAAMYAADRIVAQSASIGGKSSLSFSPTVRSSGPDADWPAVWAFPHVAGNRPVHSMTGKQYIDSECHCSANDGGVAYLGASDMRSDIVNSVLGTQWTNIRMLPGDCGVLNALCDQPVLSTIADHGELVAIMNRFGIPRELTSATVHTSDKSVQGGSPSRTLYQTSLMSPWVGASDWEVSRPQLADKLCTPTYATVSENYTALLCNLFAFSSGADSDLCGVHAKQSLTQRMTSGDCNAANGDTVLRVVELAQATKGSSAALLTDLQSSDTQDALNRVAHQLKNEVYSLLSLENTASRDITALRLECRTTVETAVRAVLSSVDSHGCVSENTSINSQAPAPWVTAKQAVQAALTDTIEEDDSANVSTRSFSALATTLTKYTESLSNAPVESFLASGALSRSEKDTIQTRCVTMATEVGMLVQKAKALVELASVPLGERDSATVVDVAIAYGKTLELLAQHVDESIESMRTQTPKVLTAINFVADAVLKQFAKGVVTVPRAQQPVCGAKEWLAGCTHVAAGLSELENAVAVFAALCTAEHFARDRGSIPQHTGAAASRAIVDAVSDSTTDPYAIYATYQTYVEDVDAAVSVPVADCIAKVNVNFGEDNLITKAIETVANIRRSCRCSKGAEMCLQTTVRGFGGDISIVEQDGARYALPSLQIQVDSFMGVSINCKAADVIAKRDAEAAARNNVFVYAPAASTDTSVVFVEVPVPDESESITQQYFPTVTSVDADGESMWNEPREQASGLTSGLKVDVDKMSAVSRAVLSTYGDGAILPPLCALAACMTCESGEPVASGSTQWAPTLLRAFAFVPHDNDWSSAVAHVEDITRYTILPEKSRVSHAAARASSGDTHRFSEAVRNNMLSTVSRARTCMFACIDPSGSVAQSEARTDALRILQQVDPSGLVHSATAAGHAPICSRLEWSRAATAKLADVPQDVSKTTTTNAGSWIQGISAKVHNTLQSTALTDAEAQKIVSVSSDTVRRTFSGLVNADNGTTFMQPGCDIIKSASTYGDICAIELARRTIAQSTRAPRDQDQEVTAVLQTGIQCNLGTMYTDSCAKNARCDPNWVASCCPASHERVYSVNGSDDRQTFAPGVQTAYFLGMDIFGTAAKSLSANTLVASSSGHPANHGVEWSRYTPTLRQLACNAQTSQFSHTFNCDRSLTGAVLSALMSSTPTLSRERHVVATSALRSLVEHVGMVGDKNFSVRASDESRNMTRMQHSGVALSGRSVDLLNSVFESTSALLTRKTRADIALARREEENLSGCNPADFLRVDQERTPSCPLFSAYSDIVVNRELAAAAGGVGVSSGMDLEGGLTRIWKRTNVAYGTPDTFWNNVSTIQSVFTGAKTLQMCSTENMVALKRSLRRGLDADVNKDYTDHADALVNGVVLAGTQTSEIANRAFNTTKTVDGFAKAALASFAPNAASSIRKITTDLAYDILLDKSGDLGRGTISLEQTQCDDGAFYDAVCIGASTIAEVHTLALSQLNMAVKQCDAAVANEALGNYLCLTAKRNGALNALMNTESFLAAKDSTIDTLVKWVESRSTGDCRTKVDTTVEKGMRARKSLKFMCDAYDTVAVNETVPSLPQVFSQLRDYSLEEIGNAISSDADAMAESHRYGIDMLECTTPICTKQAVEDRDIAAFLCAAFVAVARCDQNSDCAVALGVQEGSNVSFETSIERRNTHCHQAFDSVAKFVRNQVWNDDVVSLAHAEGIDTKERAKYRNTVNASATFSECMAPVCNDAAVAVTLTQRYAAVSAACIRVAHGLTGQARETVRRRFQRAAGVDSRADRAKQMMRTLSAAGIDTRHVAQAADETVNAMRTVTADGDNAGAALCTLPGIAHSEKNTAIVLASTDPARCLVSRMHMHTDVIAQPRAPVCVSFDAKNTDKIQMRFVVAGSTVSSAEPVICSGPTATAWRRSGGIAAMYNQCAFVNIAMAASSVIGLELAAGVAAVSLPESMRATCGALLGSNQNSMQNKPETPALPSVRACIALSCISMGSAASVDFASGNRTLVDLSNSQAALRGRIAATAQKTKIALPVVNEHVDVAMQAWTNQSAKGSRFADSELIAMIKGNGDNGSIGAELLANKIQTLEPAVRERMHAYTHAVTTAFKGDDSPHLFALEEDSLSGDRKRLSPPAVFVNGSHANPALVSAIAANAMTDIMQPEMRGFDASVGSAWRNVSSICCTKSSTFTVGDRNARSALIDMSRAPVRVSGIIYEPLTLLGSAPYNDDRVDAVERLSALKIMQKNAYEALLVVNATGILASAAACVSSVEHASRKRCEGASSVSMDIDSVRTHKRSRDVGSQLTASSGFGLAVYGIRGGTEERRKGLSEPVPRAPKSGPDYLDPYEGSFSGQSYVVFRKTATDFAAKNPKSKPAQVFSEMSEFADDGEMTQRFMQDADIGGLGRVVHAYASAADPESEYTDFRDVYGEIGPDGMGAPQDVQFATHAAFAWSPMGIVNSITSDGGPTIRANPDVALLTVAGRCRTFNIWDNPPTGHYLWLVLVPVPGRVLAEHIQHLKDVHRGTGIYPSSSLNQLSTKFGPGDGMSAGSIAMWGDDGSGAVNASPFVLQYIPVSTAHSWVPTKTEVNQAVGRVFSHLASYARYTVIAESRYRPTAAVKLGRVLTPSSPAPRSTQMLGLYSETAMVTLPLVEIELSISAPRATTFGGALLSETRAVERYYSRMVDEDGFVPATTKEIVAAQKIRRDRASDGREALYEAFDTDFGLDPGTSKLHSRTRFSETDGWGTPVLWAGTAPAAGLWARAPPPPPSSKAARGRPRPAAKAKGGLARKG